MHGICLHCRTGNQQKAKLGSALLTYHVVQKVYEARAVSISVIGAAAAAAAAAATAAGMTT